MSDSIDVRGVVPTADIVRETCAAYERGAVGYAEATQNFAAYPGLREALLGFAGGVPGRLPVLDLGCGGGRDARLMAGRGRRVVAADISLAMLTCAWHRTDASTRPNVRFVRANMLGLPFDDARFGGVWACGSILHLPAHDIPVALAEIRRTLVPAGVAALSMRAGAGEGWRDGGTLPGRRWFTFVDPQTFAGELERAGFRNVEIEFVGRRDWFIAVGVRR